MSVIIQWKSQDTTKASCYLLSTHESLWWSRVSGSCQSEAIRLKQTNIWLHRNGGSGLVGKGKIATATELHNSVSSQVWPDFFAKLLRKCITVPGRQEQTDSPARCVLWMGRTPVSQNGRVIGSPIRNGTHHSHQGGVRGMLLPQNLSTLSLTHSEFVHTSTRDSKNICTMGLGSLLLCKD